MPIIVEENQKGKLKRRQSYRSQRENTSEDSNGYDEADGMKYGGMKKKKMKKKKVMKANKGISVNHSMDHPDVVAAAERDKKNTEEFKEKYPIFSKLMPKQSDKEIKQRAKRFVDRVQTEGAKIRTATEGSFSKGGSVMARGNKLARSKPTKIY